MNYSTLEDAIPFNDKKRPYTKGKLLVESIAKSSNDHRVSEGGLTRKFEMELNYCLNSFSAFATKSQNNAQYKLIINQFHSLFKKFDGHIDEVFVNEKLVEAGEKLLSIKGFHLIAKNSCFENARVKMEGSSFGSSNKSSLTAFTSSEASETPDYLYEKRPRRTLGKLLSIYFNLRYRIEFGVTVSHFLEIVQFDYGLKSQSAITDIRSILKKLKEIIILAQRINIDNAIWVAAHGIYHYLEISKFAIEQTNSVEVS